jgi:DNA repair exonuclease SbcCD ATPase subunit
MVVKELTIKNLKSFGNETQKISLTDEGKLILLSGRNGAGKSSIIDSFDYVFFNKVAGRKAKKVKLTSLPNRINGNLEVGIEFKALDGTDVKILRGYKPSVLKLWENGIENDRAGKDKINEMIENYVGVDHETFKGFISMSINDFKNFISLSNEEKKLLLDKLFNLEVINILNTILNKFIKQNKEDIRILEREIDLLEENIKSIDNSIEKIKAQKEKDTKSKLSTIKKEIETKIKPFKEVKEKLAKVETKKSEISKDIDTEKSSLYEVNSDIKQTEKQLKLFENDKCPTCEADLNSGFHKGIKESYELKLEELNKLKKEIISKGSLLKKSFEKLDKLYEQGNEKYFTLNSELNSLKREYDKLKKESENEESTLDIKEFEENLKSLNDKVDIKEKEKSEENDKTEYHKYLKSVFSDSGVKKTIIQNIIEPINFFIEENVKKMNLPFEVSLDDSFNADITTFGEDIDTETLSTGETKKINIAIMIAYLKLIRTKKQLNILFLDEVFSSVDVESINYVIDLLRDLADTSKINIFLVHHSVLDNQSFDKILKVEKDVFSYITEKDIYSVKNDENN